MNLQTQEQPLAKTAGAALLSSASTAALISGATVEQFAKALIDSPQLSNDPRMSDALAKSTFAQNGSATSGLTYYDLELGAKFLYPVLTPIRNETPRVSGKGGIQANWRAITGINTSGVRIGVSAGNRGGVIVISTMDYIAAYKGIGLEDNVDFEAQYAAQNFDDIRAIAAKVGLESLMLGEEIVLLGGNTSLQLGITPTPAATVSTTGGALAATQYCYCVAMCLEGVLNASLAGGVPTSIVRTNADGSQDTFGGGTGQISAAVTGTISTGTTNSIKLVVAPVRGGIGYAWFWGTSTGNAALGAITASPTYTIVGPPTGTQLASAMPAVDYSTNNLIFDGLLTQALKSGSNAYWADLGGAGLTADGAGGIVEFDALLKNRWDLYRLSPDTVWISSQEAITIAQRLLSNSGSTGAYRVVVTPERGAIMGGVMVATYMNKFSMAGANILQVRIHPNLPAGVALFTTSKLPYPLSNVSNVYQVRCRQDYYQIEWPLRTRRYEFGVYADEVLQHYFPPSLGVITGIAN